MCNTTIRYRMVVSTNKARTLTAADWANAGYKAFVEAGYDAVAVERIAARLGVTKGSFYWHFANRDALMSAVLDLWRDDTEQIASTLAAIDDPRERLRRLFELVISHLPTRRSEIDLLGHTDDPTVSAVVDEVSSRRIEFIEHAFIDAGVPPATAADHALQTYALWVGLLQMQSSVPSTMPASEADRRRLVRSTNRLVERLLPDR